MIGRNLGLYRVVEQVGSGGMAIIYKGYDPSTDRFVALKVLPEHFALDDTFRKRFQSEAKAIAKLEHPNILPIYSFGEDQGVVYMAMRYMPTGTLADLMKQGPLPLREISRLTSQIASALDYAHSHGILHRDVKPSNVLIDASGNTYLTDFGIAKMLEATQALTGDAILGTPSYMSPEQCEGRHDLTPATDIYSLGVILYEMTTGRRPFDAETPMATVLQQLHAPLPPPRQIQPDLPEAAERALFKALAKQPEARFATAGALALAFADAVSSEPAGTGERKWSALPSTEIAPPPKPPAAEGAKRGWIRWALVGAGLFVLAVTVVGGVLLLGGRSGDVGPDASPEVESAAVTVSRPSPSPVTEVQPTPAVAELASPAEISEPAPSAPPTPTATPVPVTPGLSFEDSGQRLDAPFSYDVVLGDLDGDGDLDAVAAGTDSHKIWLNDGRGSFMAVDQNLGTGDGVVLGDLDGDSFLDALFTGLGAPEQVWLNNGSGRYGSIGQQLTDTTAWSAALGDLDGDGDLDAFIANVDPDSANNVWLNNGGGFLSDSGQRLGNSSSRAVALGDLDGDGDLDAFVGNEFHQPNTVWLNNGAGTFSDTGQQLGESPTFSVVLGDVDGDGDLDAAAGNCCEAGSRIWLNDGLGNFSGAGPTLSGKDTRDVALGDLDGDGDQDVFVVNFGPGTEDGSEGSMPERDLAWLNDGSGGLVDTYLMPPPAFLGQAAALGDLDGDGDLDAFIINDGPTMVWLNGGPDGAAEAAEFQLTLYDGFDDPAYDGSVNHRIWFAEGESCWQADGVYQATSNCFLEVAQPSRVRGRQLETQEARLLVTGLDRIVGGEWVVSDIKAVADFDGDWWEADCGILAEPNRAVVHFLVYDTRLEPEAAETLHLSELPIENDRWYQVQLGVEPETMTFSCLVDGIVVGVFTPENGDELRGTLFKRWLHSGGEAGGEALILADYVRLIRSTE